MNTVLNSAEPSPLPREEPYIIADCGHEVYGGELLIDWTRGKSVITLCPDCFRDKLGALSLAELALHFGCTYTTLEMT